MELRVIVLPRQHVRLYLRLMQTQAKLDWLFASCALSMAFKTPLRYSREAGARANAASA